MNNKTTLFCCKLGAQNYIIWKQRNCQPRMQHKNNSILDKKKRLICSTKLKRESLKSYKKLICTQSMRHMYTYHAGSTLQTQLDLSFPFMYIRIHEKLSYVREHIGDMRMSLNSTLKSYTQVRASEFFLCDMTPSGRLKNHVFLYLNLRRVLFYIKSIAHLEDIKDMK